MKTIVRLKEIPLGQLVAATMTALNLESNGCVIGNLTENKDERYYEVKALQLFQTVERKPASAFYAPKEWEINERFLNIIGGFHWHAHTRTTKNGEKIYEEGKLRLGRLDKRMLREVYPKGIELLATLNPIKRMREIEIALDYLSAPIIYHNNVYRIDIAAFYLEKNKVKKAVLDVKASEVISVLGA